MKKLSLIILAGFVAFSCAKEPAELGNGEGKGVTVRFSTSDFNQVSSRATDEYSVKDVWVLQYKDGNLVTASKKLLTAVTDGLVVGSGRAIELTGLVDMAAAANAADSTKNFVVFLANLSEIGVTEAQIDGLTTVAALNALRVDVDQTTTFGKVLPMRGFYYGGISTVATTQLNVNLERAVAKINFTVNPDNFKVGGSAAKFGITSMKLCQTPKQFGVTKNPLQPALPIGVANGVTPQGFIPYPAKTAGDFFEITENLSITGARTFTAYVAENVRGSYNSIANNGDKIPAKVNASAPTEGDYLTYIEVVGEYVDGSMVKNATYKIYLGGNATGDMNLIANTTYDVTTYLHGANEADTRISVDEIFNQATLTNLQKPSNSYIINATGSEQTLTIPLSQLAEGWVAINLTITDPAQKVDIVDLLSNESNWSAETLWKDWSGNLSTSVTAVPTGVVLKRYMTVTVPAGVTNGHNCVIALYDRRAGSVTEGKIIWSWHLWITDYAPSATGSTATAGKVEQYISSAFLPGGLYNGKHLMDRNLGSTITGATDIAAMMSTPATATPANAVALRGMMYQWGRKDVFTPSTSTVDATTTPAISTSTVLYDKDGIELTEKANSGSDATTGVFSMTAADISAAGITNKVLYAVQNPLHFLANGGDWTGIAGAANTYWANGLAKGAFDPCPAGWRVPTASTNPINNVWAGLNNQLPVDNIINGGENKTIFEWLSNGVNNNTTTRATAGRIFKDQTTTNPAAWYPASGYRASASGAFNNVGSFGYSWSSSVTGTTGYNLYFAATYVYPAITSNRANGFPVRCIQE